MPKLLSNIGVLLVAQLYERSINQPAKAALNEYITQINRQSLTFFSKHRLIDAGKSLRDAYINLNSYYRIKRQELEPIQYNEAIIEAEREALSALHYFMDSTYLAKLTYTEVITNCLKLLFSMLYKGLMAMTCYMAFFGVFGVVIGFICFNSTIELPFLGSKSGLEIGLIGGLLFGAIFGLAIGLKIGYQEGLKVFCEKRNFFLGQHGEDPLVAAGDTLIDTLDPPTLPPQQRNHP